MEPNRLWLLMLLLEFVPQISHMRFSIIPLILMNTVFCANVSCAFKCKILRNGQLFAQGPHCLTECGKSRKLLFRSIFNTYICYKQVSSALHFRQILAALPAQYLSLLDSVNGGSIGKHLSCGA